MPKLPTTSPATGDPIASTSYIHTLNGNFVDSEGRTLLLRGVNLSGSSKAPLNRPSHRLDGFWETAESGGESFVGRPLNLDDGSADLHLSRLRGWGFNLLRFPVTWEALEHGGPGVYDEEFIDYVVRALRKCKEYGFRVLMDPHQDIWSRFSGGSGAPYWTLPAMGIEPRNFTATQTAILHSEYPSPEHPDPASFPAMIWSTNYGKLAAQTIFTLFFAGKQFAPKAIIDGKNIQDYLQEHMISAFGRLADKIAAAGDLLDSCVIGWDGMNEPSEGLVGWEDLRVNPTKQGSTLKKGASPTPAQSLSLGVGKAQILENWKFGAMGPSRDGTVTVDPKGVQMWAEPSSEKDGVHSKWGWKRDSSWRLGECVWAQHGIWNADDGTILRPDYFQVDGEGKEVFIRDFWRPHWNAYSARMRQSHPEAILFVAPPVFAMPPEIDEDLLKGRACYSTHYYDGLTLITRHWNWFNADALGLIRGKYSTVLQALRVGEAAIRRSFQDQMGTLKSDAKIIGEQYPTIIGEIGIPYDMDSKRSYGWTDDGKFKGDYTSQERALDASLNACDGPNILNYAIWTYCPDHSHMWGDGWDLEDLSLWSADDLRSKEKSATSDPYTSTSRLLGNEPVSSPLTSSSATLNVADGSANASSKSSQFSRSTEDLSQSSWDSAFDFLTDGARAYKAFARPYPVSTIGTPSDIQFSIAKAEFALKVLVSPEDAPVGYQKEDLATEIYLPLVHYAAPRYVQVALTEKDRRTIHRGGGENTSNLSMSTIISPPKQPGIPAIPSDVLDVDVKVSGGNWVIEGQTLRWTYPIPKQGEAAREYSAVVTRKAGPIKVFGTAEPPRFSWDSVCPTDGCQVM